MAERFYFLSSQEREGYKTLFPPTYINFEKKKSLSLGIGMCTSDVRHKHACIYSLCKTRRIPTELKISITKPVFKVSNQ
jgi:hypothetical protein